MRQLTRDAVPVTIDAGGGTELHGLRYGTGPRAILLAHMGRPGDSQEDWAPVAVELADAGLTVVTYDRRGVCSSTLDTCSTAGEAPLESWRDVVAATKHVRALGSESVIVGGASLGAMETVDALRREDVEVDGIIWFAGVLSRDLSFERSDFADLPAVPKLFVSAEHDRYGAAEDARQAYEWSSEPRTLTIVPGSRHGTDLWENGIQEGPGRAVVDVLVDFATSDG
ncbi:alpha/beta hydrolase [Ornithinimicrobium cavernae]|uniref:alpha/beta hydrolase n=1 Tax=Ornithinimicrobium cavernae TaxID=2666047 RepID=UPI000D69D7C9|nr:alpha/beta hydrolase [Ornithinimicrobium cavernae]